MTAQEHTVHGMMALLMQMDRKKTQLIISLNNFDKPWILGNTRNKIPSSYIFVANISYPFSFLFHARRLLKYFLSARNLHGTQFFGNTYQILQLWSFISGNKREWVCKISNCRTITWVIKYFLHVRFKGHIMPAPFTEVCMRFKHWFSSADCRQVWGSTLCHCANCPSFSVIVLHWILYNGF